AFQACVFTYRANQKFYLTDPDLQAQYQKMVQDEVNEQMEILGAEYTSVAMKAQKAAEAGDFEASSDAQMKLQEIRNKAGELQEAAQAKIEGLSNLASATKKNESAPAPVSAPQTPNE
ncbi:MAG: hypothetical protein K2N10_06900, partial [Muribaculaceae bacterium]|nr:hypothetical protein [Muribaculaceae bacterium]